MFRRKLNLRYDKIALKEYENFKICKTKKHAIANSTFSHFYTFGCKEACIIETPAIGLILDKPSVLRTSVTNWNAVEVC